MMHHHSFIQTLKSCSIENGCSKNLITEIYFVVHKIIKSGIIKIQSFKLLVYFLRISTKHYKRLLLRSKYLVTIDLDCTAMLYVNCLMFKWEFMVLKTLVLMLHKKGNYIAVPVVVIRLFKKNYLHSSSIHKR